MRGALARARRGGGSRGRGRADGAAARVHVGQDGLRAASSGPRRARGPRGPRGAHGPLPRVRRLPHAVRAAAPAARGPRAGGVPRGPRALQVLVGGRAPCGAHCPASHRAAGGRGGSGSIAPGRGRRPCPRRAGGGAHACARGPQTEGPSSARAQGVGGAAGRRGLVAGDASPVPTGHPGARLAPARCGCAAGQAHARQRRGLRAHLAGGDAARFEKCVKTE
mmetsp:Transcript_14245/g.48236  ORF Transcript_14245/g.48236 Transcript_14245/m.48236 type:complete len:222 (-) Transcript_14245:318-983(-)